MISKYKFTREVRMCAIVLIIFSTILISLSSASAYEIITTSDFDAGSGRMQDVDHIFIDYIYNHIFVVGRIDSTTDSLVAYASGYDISGNNWANNRTIITSSFAIDWDDFGCEVQRTLDATYLHCVYADGNYDSLLYRRCNMTNTGTFLSCGAEETLWDASLGGESSTDDIFGPAIAIDESGCVLAVADFEDDSEVAADEHKVILFKENITDGCGDGAFTMATGFPIIGVQTADLGYNTDLKVSIESVGGKDAIIAYEDTDSVTVTRYASSFFNGTSNTVAAETEIDGDIAFGAARTIDAYNNTIIAQYFNDDETNIIKRVKLSANETYETGEVDTTLDAVSGNTYMQTFCGAWDSVAGKYWLIGADDSDRDSIYVAYLDNPRDASSTFTGKTKWIADYGADYSMYFAARFNNETCDIYVSWVSNSSTPQGWYIDNFSTGTSGCYDYTPSTEDTTAPSVILSFPTNTTYDQLYSYFNYSISDDNIDKCWYANATDDFQYISCSATNWTLFSDEGSNFLNISANDTSGNINSSAVWFSVYQDLVNIDSPTSNQVFSQEAPTAYINVSTDKAQDTCVWSLDSGVTNHTFTKENDTYFYNATAGETLLDGDYSIIVYCNNSEDVMKSSTSRTFYIDPVNITRCRNLAVQNREYELQNNLHKENGRCLQVLANNVTINGGDNTISINSLETYASDGIYGVTGVTYLTINDLIILHNVTDDAAGSYGDAIRIGGASAHINNVRIIINDSSGAQYSHGIVFANGANYGRVTNSEITCHGGEYCVSGVVVSGVNISQSTINAFGPSYALLIVGSDLFVSDTIITGGTTATVNCQATNNIYLNSSFDTSAVSGSGVLLKEWYYDAFVESSGTPLDDVTVTAYNVSEAEVDAQSTASGNIDRVNLIEYIETADGVIYNTPHNFTFVKDGYTSQEEQHNLTAEFNLFLEIDLVSTGESDPCDITANTVLDSMQLNCTTLKISNGAIVSVIDSVLNISKLEIDVSSGSYLYQDLLSIMEVRL